MKCSIANHTSTSGAPSMMHPAYNCKNSVEPSVNETFDDIIKDSFQFSTIAFVTSLGFPLCTLSGPDGLSSFQLDLNFDCRPASPGGSHPARYESLLLSGQDV